MIDPKTVTKDAVQLAAIQSFPRGKNRNLTLAECVMIVSQECDTRKQALELFESYRPRKWPGIEEFRRYVRAKRHPPADDAPAVWNHWFGFVCTPAELTEAFSRQVDQWADEQFAEMSATERADLTHAAEDELDSWNSPAGRPPHRASNLKERIRLYILKRHELQYCQRPEPFPGTRHISTNLGRNRT